MIVGLHQKLNVLQFFVLIILFPYVKNISHNPYIYLYELNIRVIKNHFTKLEGSWVRHHASISEYDACVCIYMT